MPAVRGFRDMPTHRPATTVVDPRKSPQRPVGACIVRPEACTRFVLGRGDGVMSQGVAMHLGGSAHRRADVWALDDWR
jgi:hypothetical protein